jgi:hypothetical protein
MGGGDGVWELWKKAKLRPSKQAREGAPQPCDRNGGGRGSERRRSAAKDDVAVLQKQLGGGVANGDRNLKESRCLERHEDQLWSLQAEQGCARLFVIWVRQDNIDVEMQCKWILIFQGVGNLEHACTSFKY